MGLNFPRPEVSRASSEYKLLANLRQGTNEYVLLRGMDLSFDDPAMAAYHYRSYAHWCNTLRSQPRYDHYLGRYCDVLGQLYYDLSEGYRSVACDLDASIQDQDIYNPGLVLWDKQFGQTVHLPLLLFQHNPRELAKVFQSKSSLEERESEMTKIQAVIDILPGLVEDPWKRDIFHNQLCYLYAFQDGVREILAQYRQAFAMPAASENAPAAAVNNGQHHGARRPDEPAEMPRQQPALLS